MNNSILLKMEKIFVVFALLSAACLSAYSQSKGFSRGIDLFNNSDRQVKYIRNHSTGICFVGRF